MIVLATANKSPRVTLKNFFPVKQISVLPISSANRLTCKENFKTFLL